VPGLPGQSKTIGNVDGNAQITFDVTLNPRNPAALLQFATSVATPGSAIYRDYLQQGEFASEFGPTSATISAVETSLRSLGLDPGTPSPDSLSIPVTATVQSIEQAFDIGLNNYRLPNGRVAFANTAPPLIPGTIVGSVQGVIGLDDIVQANHASVQSTPVSNATLPGSPTSGPQPCSAATSAADAYTSSPSQYAYTYNEIADAYGFNGPYSQGDFGAGTTVGIAEFELDPTGISAFDSCYNITTNLAYQVIDGGPSAGDGLETALDIDTVAALAPSADIEIFQGPDSSEGIYDTYDAMITSPTVNVISTSWGICEAEQNVSTTMAENTLFQEAAALGKTIVAASGDSGSEGCAGYGDSTDLAVEDPASQPFALGVGGTQLLSAQSTPTESAWSQSTGGLSLLWPMPSYQSDSALSLDVVNSTYSHVANTGSVNGTTNPATALSAANIGCNATSAGTDCREVPDVSADASPESGYIVYWNGVNDGDPASWYDVYGTSAAAPLWAALFALADAQSGCVESPVGFANPLLYAIAGSSLYAQAFTDISTGNNDLYGDNGGDFPATAGYDMATGLGTPKATALVPLLCADTVTFDANGGSGSMSNESFTTGVAAPLTMNSFTFTGYGFADWNTAANGSGTGYTNGQSVTIDASTTLYAQWTPNIETVTFDANGGSGSMSNESFTTGVATPLTMNSFTRAGYSFAYWSTAANGSGTNYTNGQSVTIDASTTLYAQWKPNIETVTFDANGGSGSMSNERFTTGAAGNLTLNSFTRAGYSFAYWSTAANGSGTGYTNGQSITIDASTTLYAQWKPNRK